MDVDIEKIIQAEIAGNIIKNMKSEDINKILEASLAKTLKDALSPWNVEAAIQKDVQRYLEEYLKRPDVQDRIKAETMKRTDDLISGVIAVIISKSQDGIKSNYSKFVDKVSYDEVLEEIKKNRESKI